MAVEVAVAVAGAVVSSGRGSGEQSSGAKPSCNWLAKIAEEGGG